MTATTWGEWGVSTLNGVPYRTHYYAKVTDITNSDKHKKKYRAVVFHDPQKVYDLGFGRAEDRVILVTPNLRVGVVLE